MKKWVLFAAVFCGLAAVLDWMDRRAGRSLKVSRAEKSFRVRRGSFQMAGAAGFSVVKGDYLRRAVAFLGRTGFKSHQK